MISSRSSQEREKIEGSPLIVCMDCKEMVLQVQKSRNLSFKNQQSSLACLWLHYNYSFYKSNMICVCLYVSKNIYNLFKMQLSQILGRFLTILDRVPPTYQEKMPLEKNFIFNAKVKNLRLNFSPFPHLKCPQMPLGA